MTSFIATTLTTTAAIANHHLAFCIHSAYCVGEHLDQQTRASSSLASLITLLRTSHMTTECDRSRRRRAGESPEQTARRQAAGREYARLRRHIAAARRITLRRVV